MTINPEIIFEDDHLLVLNKPAGLVVHEGSGVTGPTLVDWIIQHFPTNSKLERNGLVHRLDKDTSGIILIAKDDTWFKYLKDQFKRHQITKTYVALVGGKLTPNTGTIQIPIARDTLHRTKYRADKNGRPSTTTYQVIKSGKDWTLLEASPKTGRTHQIRVHFAAIGHPIIGDAVYGKRSSQLPRQFLHAARIAFIDPAGESRIFEAPLPVDLTHYLNAL